MNIQSFVSWAVSQPWSFAVPFVAAVFADWAVGSLVAWRTGVFQKVKVFNWIETTVGWQKGIAVVGSVAMAYFLAGQHQAYLALVPLVAVNGSAFLVVIADIKQKIADLLSPPKAPAKADPQK